VTVIAVSDIAVVWWRWINYYFDV